MSSPLGELPLQFRQQLRGLDELLVSSRDQDRTGRVRMWFAVDDRGLLYLLTRSLSLKAARWLDDPWVRVRIPGGPAVEGLVEEVSATDRERLAPLLVERFSMAGAVTTEALEELLDSGSHRLHRVRVLRQLS